MWLDSSQLSTYGVFRRARCGSARAGEVRQPSGQDGHSGRWYKRVKVEAGGAKQPRV